MRQKLLEKKSQIIQSPNKLYSDYKNQIKNKHNIQNNLFRNKVINQQLNITRNSEIVQKHKTSINNEKNKNEDNKPKKSHLKEYSKKLFLEKRRKERLAELNPIKLDIGKKHSVFNLVSPKKDEKIINKIDDKSIINSSQNISSITSYKAEANSLKDVLNSNENNIISIHKSHKISHSLTFLYKKKYDDSKKEEIFNYENNNDSNFKNKKEFNNSENNSKKNEDYLNVTFENNSNEIKRKSHSKIHYNYLKNKNGPLSSNNSRKSNLIDEKEQNHSYTFYQSKLLNKNKIQNFNLENLYISENLLQNIIQKLKVCEPNYNECFEFLNFYYNYEIYQIILDLFKESNNREKIDKFLKIEILCYCMNYDISYTGKFQEVAIILKSIFNLICFNFLVIIKFILQKTKKSKENLEWYKQLENLIKYQLTLNIKKDYLNEYDIIKIFEPNFQQISDFYNIILNNIYSKNYHPEIFRLRFPYILKNENAIGNFKIISSNFFYDAYEKTKSFLMIDLKKFYNIFLFRIPDPNGSYILSYRLEITKENIIENKEINTNYFLPSRDPKFEFTLVIDLDETLIHFKRSSDLNSKKGILVFRPYLFYFLSLMKKEYELVLFSFGNEKYVDPIINMIEKKEKYFSYRLYRRHAILSGKNFVKDLSKLGRDLKTILIIDNLPQAFKLQKENGIWVKAFYGDCKGDNETLKNLGDVLERIKYDAMKTKDIRISLAKEQNNLVSQFNTIKI